MAPVAVGSKAPPVPDLDLEGGATALFFYKVTCPVCQLAAPKIQTFERAYPGHIRGIGQDAPAKLDDFAAQFGMTFPSSEDLPAYPVSEAYGIRVVPTVFLVDRGVVGEVVESWDRDALNDLSRHLAELTGSTYAPISEPSDGLPVFRPG